MVGSLGKKKNDSGLDQNCSSGVDKDWWLDLGSIMKAESTWLMDWMWAMRKDGA